MFTKALSKVVFLAAIVLIPASLTAGPRVDYTGEWCSKCCDAWCPYDNHGYFAGCFPDLDATICEYNDRHFLLVGGCN